MTRDVLGVGESTRAERGRDRRQHSPRALWAIVPQARTSATERDRRWHSRRTLLWLSAVAPLAQLVAGLVLDHLCPEIRFPDAAETRRALRQAVPPPAIVCLGSSRFQGGVRHDVVNPLLRQATNSPLFLFNAAVPAGDPVVYDLLLDDVLRLKPLPRLLVLEVSPETLARYSTFLPMHLLRQITWLDVPAFAPELERNGGWTRLLQAKLLPLWVHRLEMQRHVAPLRRRGAAALHHRLPYPAADWPVLAVPPLVRPPGTGPLMDLTREHLRYKLRDYAINGICSRSLERVLERCRQCGLEVLLVGVPAPGPCREGYSPAVEAVYRAYLAGLRSRFGCAFIDLRASVPDEGFGDATHLTFEGAALFSNRLVREALLPWWRPRTARGVSETLRAFPKEPVSGRVGPISLQPTQTLLRLRR